MLVSNVNRIFVVTGCFESRKHCETPCILQIVISKTYLKKIQFQYLSTLLIKCHKNRKGKEEGLGILFPN